MKAYIKETQDEKIVDSAAWRNCSNWYIFPGWGEACYNICSKKQRDACRESFRGRKPQN